MARSAFAMAFVAMTCSALSLASADVLTLTDGTSTFRYDSDAPAGGNADLSQADDVLFQETWFLRYDDALLGSQIEELTGGVAASAGNAGSLTFTGVGAGVFTTGFDVVLNYEVNTTFGTPTLVYTASITNTNVGTETISVYNYFDHDIGGFAGDTSTFVNQGATDRLVVSDFGVGDSRFRETTAATHFQFVDWSADLDTAIRNDTVVDLNDTGANFGPGDFSGALQWDFTLNASQTVVLSGTIGVPEPASCMVLGIAVVGICVRRRQR